MAIKAKARTTAPAPAPVEADEAADPTSVDVNTVVVEGEGAGASDEAGAGEESGARERGPFLRWNADRNAALAQAVADAVADGTTPSPISLTEALAGDPAFAGLPEGALVPYKVRLQVSRLRKSGAKFPDLASDRGGRATYQADIASLNEILGG